MPKDNTKETNIIRTVLTTEVRWVIGIIVFVFGIATPYYGIKQDIALIQKDVEIINANHEVHIQDILQVQKEQQANIIEMQKQILLIINHK